MTFTLNAKRASCALLPLTTENDLNLNQNRSQKLFDKYPRIRDALNNRFSRQPCYSFAKKPRKTIIDEIVQKFQYKNQKTLNVNKGYNYMKPNNTLVPKFEHCLNQTAKNTESKNGAFKDSYNELQSYYKYGESTEKSKLSSYNTHN